MEEIETATYKEETVRVLMRLNGWVYIWIPSRQEEVAVKEQALTLVGRQKEG